ncbi:hypothetical protein ACFE04_004655 [Oxalis oulophora]
MSSSPSSYPSKSSSTSSSTEDEAALELRRGPWTLEEDTLLVHYITRQGEGRWNLLAKRSGLKRTGKSCRLRWLNYLKPDVKRGNLSPQEQLLILELHFKWGNRWSKIAQHLPGRTDNEIKNYWRTRVQKHARHLNIDPSSIAFREVIKCYYMPILAQKIECSSSIQSNSVATSTCIVNPTFSDQIFNYDPQSSLPSPDKVIYENSDTSQITEYQTNDPFDHAMGTTDDDYYNPHWMENPTSAPECHVVDSNWTMDGMWNMDELWQRTSQDTVF